MNKRGLKIGNWLMGILLFSIVLISFGNLMGDLNSHYDVSSNTTFVNTYNKLSEVGDITQQMNEKVVGAEIDDAEPAATLSTGMLNAVRLIMQAPSIIYQFFRDLVYSDMIPIDPSIQVGLLAIFMLLVILAIIGLIFGKDIGGD